MPPALQDTDHAMVISRRTRCSVLPCNRFATYDVSMPERYGYSREKTGQMSDWQPMCYRCAKAATEGKITR